MNIEVIKCFNLLFCKSGFINNYGNYILLFEILIFLILMLLFYFKYKKNFIELISQIYPKYNYNKISCPPLKKINRIKGNNSNKNNSNEYLIHKKEKLKTIRKEKRDDKKEKKHKKNDGKKDKKKNNNKKINNKNKYSLKIFNIKEKKGHFRNKNLDSTHKIINDIFSYDKNQKNTIKILEKDIKVYKKNKNNKKILNLCDEEINTLEYKEAIILDKRAFCQYYFSIIKKRNIILFTFISQNDYNLIKIKICLFIISFSLYFTINSLFFTDKTMRKIYKEKGKYNIISQLPKIFYSSFITTVINIILKSLALSEKSIICLKKVNDKIKDKKKINHSIKEVFHRLKIQFNIFFIIDLYFCAYFGIMFLFFVVFILIHKSY